MIHSLLLLSLINCALTAAGFGCLNLFGQGGQCMCDPCPPCNVRERPVYIHTVPTVSQQQPPTVDRVMENQYPEAPMAAPTRLDLYAQPSSTQFNMERVDTVFRERPVCQSRRWTRSVDFPEFADGISGSSEDRLCNSPQLRDIIMKNIRALPDNAKMSIAKNLPKKGPPFVVICSSTPFSFVTSHESEYCYGGENNTHCYVFSV